MDVSTLQRLFRSFWQKLFGLNPYVNAFFWWHFFLNPHSHLCFTFIELKIRCILLTTDKIEKFWESAGGAVVVCMFGWRWMEVLTLSPPPESPACVLSGCCTGSFFVVNLHCSHKISNVPFDMSANAQEYQLRYLFTMSIYSGMVMWIRKCSLNLQWHHANSRIGEMFYCFISHLQFYSLLHLYIFLNVPSEADYNKYIHGWSFMNDMHRDFFPLSQNYLLRPSVKPRESEKMLLQHTLMSSGLLSQETTWDLWVSCVKRWGINRLWHVVLLRRIGLQLNVFIVEPMVRLFERETAFAKGVSLLQPMETLLLPVQQLDLCSHSSGLLYSDTVQL